jgi:hypothetical protein
MWLEVGSGKMAFSRPAHQRVTQAVRQFNSQVKDQFTSMKNQIKFGSAIQFFLASSFLFSGLHNFGSALAYDGSENNFVADNWSIALVLLLSLFFGLGWWSAYLHEYLVLLKGQKVAALVFLSILLVFGIMLLGSIIFVPRGFMRFSILASGYFLMSGFSFRFSVVRREVTQKLQSLIE